MNLQQLRSVNEVVRRGMSVTRAAERLNTSQPVVTRHIQGLEEDLGVQLFVRDRKRLVSLSDAGLAVMPLVEKVLGNLESMRTLAAEFNHEPEESVTVATVHTHGRSILPAAVQTLMARYPRVHVRLLHGPRRQVIEWVSEGKADISVAAMPQGSFPEVLFAPCYEVHVVVICPKGHPLLQRPALSLSDIAEFPIITYDETFSARSEIDRPFLESGIKRNIVLTTTHADILKEYVSAGFGIGLVGDTVYDSVHDTGLEMIDARHLFRSNIVHLGVNRTHRLGRCSMHLIRSLTPAFADRLKDLGLCN